MNKPDLLSRLGRECRHFLVIAECGSFLSASTLLYISQPALIKQINLLEKDLGFRLFYRSHSGVTLTEAGKKMQAGLSSLYQEWDMLLAACQEEAVRETKMENSRLLVGYLESDYTRSLFSVRIAAKYKKIWPNTDLSLIGLPLDTFLNAVSENKVDVVSCFETSAMQESGLSFSPISEHGCHCLLSADHPLAKKEKLNLEDLARGTVLVPKAGLFYVTDCIQKDLKKMGCQVEECIYNKTTPMKTLIENKVMVSFGNVYEYPGGVTLPLSYPVSARFGIVSRPSPDMAVQNFIRLAEEG